MAPTAPPSHHISTILTPSGEVVEIGDETDCCCVHIEQSDPMMEPLLSAHEEAIADCLRSMLALESDPVYVPSDYLSPARRRRRRRAAARKHRQGRQEECPAAGPQQSQQDIDRSCRTKMIQWMYNVIDYCNFSRESVAVASSHLDRFLSAAADAADDDSSSANAASAAMSPLTDRRTYQLAAVTALFLSIKTTEPVVLTTQMLSDFSEGLYTEAELVDMELQILGALGWRLSRPTPLEFAEHMLKLLPSSLVAPRGDSLLRKLIMDLVRHQIELSVADYELSVNCLPSAVAVSAIQNALEIMIASSSAKDAGGPLSSLSVPGYLELVRSAMGMEHPLRIGDVVKDRLARTLRLTTEGSLLLASKPRTAASAAVKHSGQRKVGGGGAPVATAANRAQGAASTAAKSKTITSPVCVSSHDQESNALNVLC